MKNTSIKFRELTKDELTSISGGTWLAVAVAYILSEVAYGVEDGLARAEECC